MTGQDRIELEDATGIAPVADRRPMVPQPLPVRLVAVEDVRQVAPLGAVGRLERFYIDLLGFALDEIGLERLGLRAENVRLLFDFVDALPARQDYRPIWIEVDSLREWEEKLRAAEVKYERMKGISAGADRLILLDPAGNWLEISEKVRVI